MEFTYMVVLLSYCVISSESARILSVIPTPSRSHYSSCRRVILELARRGHEVVSISPYEEKNAPPNFKWIQTGVTNLQETFPNFKEKMMMEKSFFGGQLRLWKMMNYYSKHIIGLPALKGFIEEDRSRFDLVIAEEFMQQVFYTFSYKYRAPLVLMSTFGGAHYIDEYMGNSLEISYVPHEFSDMYGEMDLWDRARNLAYTAFDLLLRRWYVLPFQNELAEAAFSGLGDLPKVEELQRNASLILINSHYSTSIVRPLLPNMIEIGGSHIEDPKPLEHDLKEILNEADNGTILFSFGSFLTLSTFPEPLVVSVLRALGRIPQRVLLRWDPKVKFPVSSPNIYPMAWLPQNDILAHPNLIGLVTHGGLLSSQEAIYHGVPTVCVPSFGDQYLNCRKSVQIGYGIRLHRDQLKDPDALYGAILKLTKDKRYRVRAKELSKRFRERQNSALDTAVYWIEYVLRHNGADFMKGPGRNMPWHQYYTVDIAVIVLATSWALLKTVYLLCGLVFKKNDTEKVKID